MGSHLGFVINDSAVSVAHKAILMAVLRSSFKVRIGWFNFLKHIGYGLFAPININLSAKTKLALLNRFMDYTSAIH